MTPWKDGVCKRCSCLNAPRCTCFPWIRVQHNNERIVKSVTDFAFLVEPPATLPTTLSDAKVFAQLVVAWLAKGKPAPVAPPAPAPTGITMNALIDAWVETRKVKRRTQRPAARDNFDSKVRRARKFFGTKLVTEVTEGVLNDFVTELMDAGKSIATPNRIIGTVVRPAMLWGLHKKLWPGPSPFGKYGFRIDTDAENKRDQRCTPDTEARLLEACAVLKDARYDYCGQTLEDFIIMAIDLGARTNELLALTTDEVDWQDHLLTMRKTKRDKETRFVPFNPTGRVATILERRRFVGKRGNPAPIISDADGRAVKKIYRAWVHAVCLAHGIPYKQTGRAGRPTPATIAAYKAINLRPHDLRHEASTWWGQCGVSDPSAELLQGHASQTMHGRYKHEKLVLATTELREKVWPREDERAVRQAPTKKKAAR